jgi:alkylated DNA nucleotide flippase Atl1
MGVSAYPIAPSLKTTGAQYTGFQTRPKAAAGTYNVADAAHPSAGDCSQCHSGNNYFTGQDKPANHIPTSATAQCSACHTTMDYGVLPTLANIHANAPSTTGNCAQCHGANVVAGFAIPGANFTIQGPPANHLPITTACETCHVGPGSSVTSLPVANGARFSGSLMSHSGITSNCIACHGPSITNGSFVGVSQIVVMPPTSPAGAGAHIPSTTSCETCHLATTPSGLIPASASKNAPGTAFQSPAPTTTQIHTGITGGCSGCHDTNFVWMGVNAYPIAPSVKTAGAQYTGFQTRPKAAAGTYSVADATHPSAGDCSQCHSGINYFTGQDKPANHIPTSATAQCSACHTSSDYSVMPTLANIHANAPSTTGNCAQCHGAAAPGFAIPAANFSIVGLPANHIPTSVSCETCHVGAGSSIASLPVANGAKFSNSLMSHSGIASNCVACHVPSGAPASFAGITQIVGMPATSPAGPSAHIPSSTSCETCHLATTPSGLIAASATKTAPGSLFAAPAPTGVQIHTGITGGCSACHDTSLVWMGVSAYPISPSTLTAGAQYRGFQARPGPAAGSFTVADAAHPSTGDCSQCHSGTVFFTGQDKPANHIPTSATAQCNSCHTSTDYAVIPTLANIHANAPSTTTNCAQCHGAAAASFAIPAAGFAIVGLPANHIPTAGACETCHVGAGSSIASLPVGNGAKFNGSLMSHAGITNNCVACHVPSGTSASFAGIAQIVGMPATSPPGAGSHIPSSTTCETCHLATTPAGLIAASSSKTAPGTAFQTPVPTGVQIHTGITGGCSACHDTSAVWMGVSAYPISPSVMTTGAQYKGFQTRPRSAAGTYNVSDATHPSAGDCSQCHSGTTYFTGQDKPANHIPTAATAQCSSCHTSTDYSVMPTMAAIHANAPSTTSNCAQCHGAAAPSFAIPAANFTVVGLPTNHLPTSVSCEFCHVGAGSSIASLPVANGARFSGSLMSHTGITSNCVACHVPSGTPASFAGIAQIVGMPATSPMGTNAHIPSSTTCESCHLATTPAGLIAASAAKTAPGTAFQTPAPTGVQIHSGITGGCSACHDTNAVWMGVNAYPISPNTLTTGAQYRGFQARPGAAAGSFTVADAAHPSTGDCSQCHSGTVFFTGQDKPANHIPTSASAQCNSCHTSTDYAALPTLANIHANAPSTTANCAQCHGAAAASFAIPSANFSIVGLPGNHIPTAGACETCHVAAGSSIASPPVGDGAKFSGSLMSHTGITNNCEACHGASITGSSFVGVSKIVVMPPTSPAGANAHIPSTTTCETCHLGTTPTGLIAASATKTAPGTAFATPAPTGVQIHTGITGNCSACHDTSFVWMGVAAYPIAPSTMTTGAQYKGFQTRPKAAAGTYNVADVAHPSAGDCSQCHSGTTYFTGQDKPANHIPTAATAQCTACHTSADYSVLPTLANIHANAPSTTTNCAQCHGASVVAGFAIAAANFAIVGPAANHLPITTACETCHVGAGSSVATPVPNGAKFSGSKMSHAGITGNCIACHGPSITGSSFVGVGQIVVMPPTSPVGAGAHIPSTTPCETCHLGTTPSGLIAANATKTAPGTLFATPAPTGAQIHTGITGGCSGCHDTNFVWMGVNVYPISPSVMTAGAQYKGFQTRPKAAAGSFSVADVAHPSAGDCSQCHSGTTYFSGQDKPANHIPTAATAQCTACHTSTDYAVMPTLANIHANAPSTTANCAQCHDASVVAGFAIPGANFTIQGPPANHMPITSACETCHVGAGSSVSATPVPNGAKFSGSKMSHTGITSNCIACHGASITGSSFAGVTQIVVMPPTSPVGAAAHIPSTTSCETCHAGTTPAGLIAANASKTAPGTLFATPAPTGAQIHTGITGGCSACHDTGYVWMGVSAYPIAPGVKTAGAQYRGFQTRPRSAAGTYNVADATHPSVGDCSQCHSGTVFFTGQDKPANHIPTLTTAQCSACHTSTDYAVMPTLANIHANAPSSTANCAQCHDASVVAGFAIPAANFAIQGPPTNHLPITTACETCHVGAGSSVTATPVPNGAKFSSSKMSHTGITSNCIACHGASITGSSFAGVTQIVVMPPTSPVGAGAHIPSTTSCETCHAGTTPAGLIAANASKTAPGTAFATPAPTGAQIHTGITGGCSACHDTNYVWMGVNAYPIAPSVMTSGAQYKGFQTRPKAAAGTYSVADPAHPSNGDCSQCHTGTTFFVGEIMPANHIPTLGTAQCTACHTSIDYSVMPTLTNIHANAPSKTTNCAQCHAANVVAGFAIPSANFVIVGPPTNHMPITTACEACHVGTGSSVSTTPVPNGAKFSGSLMSHTGITSNCAACHGSGITGSSFAGVSKIIVMPATSPAGAAAHIPSSTVCESCHLGTTPTGLVAASATKTLPGSAFATPAPTTTQIHAGITGGCNTCHDTNFVWMGMNQYPIAPAVMTVGAQYTGFHSRPTSAGSTYAIKDAAHPSAGDCSVCHTGTNYFTGLAKPTGHIPTSGTCSTCHIVAGDYSIAGLASNAVLHTGSTTGCISCHTAGPGAGPFAGCTTQAGCASPPPVSYQPKRMPLLAGGSPTSPSSQTHIPSVGIPCESCHSKTVFTSFSGTNMKGSTPMHTAVGTATCMSCHEYLYSWFGVTIKTTGSASHHGRKAGADCTTCHTKVYSQFSGAAARVRPVMRGALNTMDQRLVPDGALTAPQVFNHAGVFPGQCQTCHNAMAANGKPAKHLQTTLSCDSCHRTSAWKPAQFSHDGVQPSQCQACHNPASATGKSSGHFVTVRSCDSCHRTVAWVPVSYQHLSPLFRLQVDKNTCLSCHVTNGEIIPRQMRGNNRPKPVPVRTGP